MNKRDYENLLTQYKNGISEEEKKKLLSSERDRIMNLSESESLDEIRFIGKKVNLIENKIMTIGYEV